MDEPLDVMGSPYDEDIWEELGAGPADLLAFAPVETDLATTDVLDGPFYYVTTDRAADIEAFVADMMSWPETTEAYWRNIYADLAPDGFVDGVY